MMYEPFMFIGRSVIASVRQVTPHPQYWYFIQL